MKNLMTILGILIVLFCSSCFGRAIRTGVGTNEKGVLKQVSVMEGCPVDSIKILEKNRLGTYTTYSLDVCGTRKVFRAGGGGLSGVEEIK